MAINVDTVYKTALLILNKEQRGYATPDEFNKIATQVQLEIFENYFEELNQFLRVPQTDTNYSDRVARLDEKMAIFKVFGDAVYDNTTLPSNPFFTLPTTDAFGQSYSVHNIGAVVYKNEVEVERLQRHDFYNIQRSPLTASTESFPTYLYESGRLFVKPDAITSNVSVDYIRKPLDVKWAFTVGPVGQYLYDSGNSVDIELHESEQTDFIIKLLFYFGVVIRDPQIVQVAAQEIQKNEVNEKS